MRYLQYALILNYEIGLRIIKIPDDVEWVEGYLETRGVDFENEYFFYASDDELEDIKTYIDRIKKELV